MSSLRLIGSLAFLGCLPFLLSSKTHALPGLSPVWERLYNNNEPFSETNPSHAPTADPDGDGWSNLRESIAGTNPFSGVPGAGFLQAACSIAPWPAESFRIEWASEIGKNYQLSHSPDLVTWTTDPASMPGTGNPLWMHVSPVHTDGTLVDRLFWRVVVSDFAAPGGSYTPYELHVLATHPDIAGAISGTSGGSGNEGTPTDPNSDGAGPTDSKDAAPNDNTINWDKTPEAKYLWIPAEQASGFVAVDANDRGQILFRRTTLVENYATDPVAKIWDPSRPENSRFIDILFQPTDFGISLWKSNNPGTHYPGDEDPVTVETAPVPTVPPDPNRSIYLNVEPRFIGPDGSVMANVTYSLYEFQGASENQTRQAGGQFVFLWKGETYDSCRILGESPGYKGNPITVLHHFAAGFYTDMTGSGSVVRALFSEQPIHLENGSGTDNLVICAQSVEADGDIKALSGEPSRNQNIYPNPRATPSGRVLITNTVDVGNLRRTVCGAGGRYLIPVNTIMDTLSDIPAQPGGATCGVGNVSGPFQLFNNGALTQTATDGVIQFDKTGTGISRGKRANQHIWRNARWMSLSEAAGLAPGSNMLNGYIPKKITDAGIIWAGNQDATSNGILVPGFIIAEENMAGVVGDIVKSSDSGSNVRHFVSPKKSTEIPQDYVEVKFANFNPSQFSSLLEWEGDEAGDSPIKRKVNRSSPGMNEIKVKLRGGNIVVARMRIWVVWSALETMGGLSSYYQESDRAAYEVAFNIQSVKRFRFSILPPSIITDAERPDLSGASLKRPPGHGVSHFILSNMSGDFADSKWDVSRQIQVILSNPDLIPANQFADYPPSLTAGQPVAVSFPSN